MLASNCCGSHCQSRTFDLVGEAEPLVVHFDAQMHPMARRDSERRREHVGLHLVWQTGHHAQVFADALVVRDVEIVELRAVVVADESRHLLEVPWLDVDDCRGAVAMRLLPSRDERLAKLAADGLATEEPQMAGTALRLKSSSGQGERSH